MDELSKSAQAPVEGQPPAPTVTEQTTEAPAQQPALSSEDSEQEEWAAAHREVFPGLESNNDEFGKDKDEPAVTTTTTETTETTTQAPAPETTETTTVSATDQTTETTTAAPEQPQANATAPSRLTPEQVEQSRQAIKADVESRLFADRVVELKDADGDPIKTIDDVMKLIDPRTKTAENPEGDFFTADSAGIWLLYAQQELNKKVETDNKEIERIAEVNLDLQQQADLIKEKYKTVLDANPTLRQQLWDRYSSTLKTKTAKGPDGKDIEIYVDMPMSLETFYETALSPYATMAQQQAQTTQQTTQAQQQQQQQRQQQREDRSDVYTPGTPDTRDDDDKEWEEAHKVVFGEDFMKKLSR